MVGCCAIVCRRLEPHFEIGDSHYLRVAHLGLIFQSQFFRSVCFAC